MVDELRTIKDNLFKILSGTIVRDATADDLTDDGDDDSAAASGRALFAALFARAGKGKDEVIQIMAREIGNAVAAMLKEPLSQLAKNQKLQISFEFVPKNAANRGENLREPDDADRSDEAPTTPKPKKHPRKGKPARAAATRRTARTRGKADGAPKAGARPSAPERPAGDDDEQ